MSEQLILTVKDAAGVIGISLPKMYEITEQADFSALIRIGRKKVILKSRFMEWLDAQAGRKE